MYLLTASLLNSWHFLLHSPYGSDADFIRVLKREPIEKTPSMQKGFEFEDWACKNMPELQNAQYQVKLSKRHGNTLYYGILDVLKAGVVTDIKYTSNYDVGKYKFNYQTGMYLFLADGAKKMQYFISTKIEPEEDEIYREFYLSNEVEPITKSCEVFYKWLKSAGLWELYEMHWKSK